MKIDYNELKEAQQNEIVYGINRDPYKVAEEQGLDVILPDSNQLQLDIDSDEAFNNFLLALNKMQNDTKFHFANIQITPSKSGLPKRHITLTSDRDMGVWQRIALQYYLQSDPVREGLNAMRVLLGDPYPIAFFEKKKVDNDQWDF